MAKLANFEFTLEAKDLKIYVKGDREIAPSIAQNVARQFSSILTPAGLIEAPKNGQDNATKVIEAQVPPARNRRRKSGRSVTSEDSGAASLTWTHDADRWGAPVQTWKTLQKSAWLLYVTGQALGKNDLSAGEICEIFKANFRDAGPPWPANISRDLSKETSLFGEDNGRFFIKQAGKDLAEKLIAEAKGTATAA